MASFTGLAQGHGLEAGEAERSWRDYVSQDDRS